MTSRSGSTSTDLRRARLAGLAYVALAGLDTALAGSASASRRRARVLVKPLLMPALAASFAAATHGRADTPARRATLAAHGLSWAGDVALLEPGETRFLAGVGGFLGAHLAYLRVFGEHGRPLGDPAGRRGPLAAAALWSVAAPVMARGAGRTAPALRLPVMGYIGVLLAMGAASTRLADDVDPRAAATIRAGAALFLTSDTVIGTREFLLTDPGPRSDAVVMATYTAGQGLIALGIARMLEKHR
ncbi:hypothetical protein GCM10022215_24390 [Nocardioides fonticola]|uniref:Lysoplasmalogenase n=1 Tax=Nocardioides fonticola TaxID=450363 RepID=A0ABP7XKW3_9ACTN